MNHQQVGAGWVVGFYSGKHAEEGIDVLTEGTQGVMVEGSLVEGSQGVMKV